MRQGRFFLLYVLISASLCTSCIKDVDFDQTEAITLTPVLAASVVYGEVEASRFTENGMEIETVRDSIANIEIFSNDFVNDNLVKVELVFEADNSINRTFNLQIDFLNDTDEFLHTLAFDVLPSTTGDDVVTEFTEVFEDESLEALKASRKMVITFRLFPSTDGSSLNENSTGKTGLKSKGIFYFNASF